MNVGVIGLGYVGSACVSLFKDYFSLSTYDIVKDCNCDSIEQLTEQSEIIFICLPTPMKEDGSCDLSIINSVLNKINSLDKNRVVVIKSTVEVGTTDKFSSIYNNLDFVFNPEFLTEANFIDDFKNQDRIIIGTKSKNNSCFSNNYIVIRKKSGGKFKKKLITSFYYPLISDRCFQLTFQKRSKFLSINSHLFH